MKVFLSVLGLAILAAGIYFLWDKDNAAKLSAQTSSAYDAFLKKLAVLNDIKQKGENTLDSLAKIAGATEKGAGDVKNFLETAPQTVSNTTSDLYGQIKNQLPPSVLNLLSGETGKSLQNYISPSGQFSVATSSGSLQGDVCVEFRNDMSVDYSIRNPFSPAKDYTYHIDWGDKAFVDGQIKTTDPELKPAHTYASSGNYLNQFKITAATTTLNAQVRVCIR